MEREQRTGIIDTLTAAFGLVNRWPVLMVPPVLLDLLLWLGPRLSLEALALSLANSLGAQSDVNREAVTRLEALAGGLDLMTLLALQTPSMLRLIDGAPPPFGLTRSIVAINDPALVVGLSLLFTIVGMFIVTLFHVPIARVVRDGRPAWATIAAPLGRAWLRRLLFFILLLIGTLVIVIPLSLVAGVLSLAGIPALALIEAATYVAIIWLGVFLFFVFDAIVLSEVGPIKATRLSIAVVRQNFWSSLGLMLLTLVILAGLWRIFLAIAQYPLGLPFAIIGNAYIATGLATASLVFFRDRLARWQQQQRAATLNRVGPGGGR
jgi:hypothetical protein